MEKSILITGCSSGIGYETAHALKKRGYRVFATARSPEDVARLRNEGFESFELDVTDSRAVDYVLTQVTERTGGTLYALFNNAGYGQPGALEDVPTDALRAQFETNVFGLHELTRKVLPIMLDQGFGRIIQHSSVLGLVSLRFRGAYNASKYAIEGLCDTLRLELADSDIFVVTLNTGPVRSKFRDNAIAKFYENIDADGSRFKEAYQTEVLKRNTHKAHSDPWTKNADAVIAKVLLALERPRPWPRYYVTEATWILATLKRLLGTRALDAVLSRIH